MSALPWQQRDRLHDHRLCSPASSVAAARNLQQAVCSYFDFDSPRELVSHQSQPSMTLLRDVTVGEGEAVTPNTRFIKTWKIQNSGPCPTSCSVDAAALATRPLVPVSDLGLLHVCR